MCSSLLISKAEDSREFIGQDKFKTPRGEARRHARKVTSRAKALSRQLEAWMKKEARKRVKEMVAEIKRGKLKPVLRKTKVEKAEAFDDKQLLAILERHGIKQINDTGREFAQTKWALSPSAEAAYLKTKRVQVQRIRRDMRDQMQLSVGKALGAWLEEDPQPSTGEIARRLREWLTVTDVARSPAALQPLGRAFTSHGIGARARMIARTEINQARNFSRIETGKITGKEFKMWLAFTDGKSGDRHHEALNNVAVPMNDLFINPITGASLMYPSDPNADSPFGVPGEIINCRCSVRMVTQRQAEELGAL